MVTSEQLASYRQDAKDLVAALYRDEQGHPFRLTDGQADIFNLIFKRLVPRNHIESYTRYGKSETVSMALLTRICTFPERWCVAAGNDDQAHIITSHLIAHLFDNEFTRSRFVIGKGEKEEEIRRYRNKSRLNFKLENGLMGEVFVTNAKGAMGFGAPNVILDEGALVSDEDEALVFRMLGDQPENFYFKIGNPWDSGHFRASAEDPAFMKLRIDYWQGVKEGRITPQMVDEARSRPFFNVLYECKFPAQGEQDEEGWIPLLTRDDIKRALVPQWAGFGITKLGGDVAGGGKNQSVIVHRQTNMARFLLRNNEPDTMNFVERIFAFQRDTRTQPEGITVDGVGVGKGACDVIARSWQNWRGTNVGDKLPDGSIDETLYLNLRAKAYWKLREWILAGGKLLATSDQERDGWLQLAKIKYRQKLEGMHGKIQIMPKEKMLKEGIESPDCADALMLTFTTDDQLITEAQLQGIAKSAEVKQFGPY